MNTLPVPLLLVTAALSGQLGAQLAPLGKEPEIKPTGAIIAADSVPMHDGKPNVPPKGFVALFDGDTLDGWFGHGT